MSYLGIIVDFQFKLDVIFQMHLHTFDLSKENGNRLNWTTIVFYVLLPYNDNPWKNELDYQQSLL